MTIARSVIERASQYRSAPIATSAPPSMGNRGESSYVQQSQPYTAPDDHNSGYDRRERYDDDYDEYGRWRNHKRGGFLSELFDFD